MAQTRRRPAPGRTQDPPEDEIEDDGADDVELDRRVNSVITGRLKRFMGDVEKMLTAQLTPIQEALAQRRAQPDEGEDPEPREDAEPDQRRVARGQRARQEPEEERQQPQRRRTVDGRYQRPEDPEVANLKKQLAALDAERKTEKEQLRARERDGLLTEALSKAGVDPLRLKGATLLLRDTLAYDDKAQAWSYRAKRDGFDEDLDVGAGVKEWAATDEGKSYLAPQQQPGRGAGTRVQQADAGARASMTAGARGQDPKAAKAARQQNALGVIAENTAALLSGG